ncbi:SRPBCC family protein [Cellulomonas sp. NTE-D12]|uniref:SRPBCC family protein n=1 Tax=Cellulomonas sp. NTE-D12 TaxID=2962632 RepID=UPI003081721D|nr:hypothetical protein CELD12_16040 [Cellulomonas sp. NTE-D12]
MTPVVVTIEVARPAGRVFDYATDPRTFVEWQEGVVEGHLEMSHPAAVGERCVTVRRIGFANRASTSEFTVVEPPHRWSIRGLDGPIRARVDVRVESLTDQRSRLTIAVDFEGHGIGRLLVPLVVVPQARREMPANLNELRRRLEAEAQ